MLPTLGLFRVFPCPYYVVGLCERPHCSFRHCRSDVEAARRELASFEADAKCDSDTEIDPVESLPPEEKKKESNTVLKKVWDSSLKKLPIVPTVVESSFGKSTINSSRESKEETKKALKRDHESSSESDSPKKRVKLDKKSGSISSESVQSLNGSFEDTLTGKAESKNKTESKINSSRSKGSDGSQSSERSHKDGHHKSHKRSHKDKKGERDAHSSSSSRRSSYHSSSSSSSRKSKDDKLDKEKRKRDSSELKESKSRKDNCVLVADESSKTGSNVTHRDNLLLHDTKMDEEELPDIDISDDFRFPSDEEDDPDQIALECFEMFQNYKSDEASSESLKLATVPEQKIVPEISNEAEGSAVGKKRVAHASAVSSTIIHHPPPKRKETVQEQLLKRFQSVQESKSSVNLPNSAPVSTPFTTVSQPRVSSTATGSNNKRRMAHVANAGALMKPPAATKPGEGVAGNSSQKRESHASKHGNTVKPTPVTISQTIGKGERRLAHAPTSSASSLTGTVPKITPDSKGKVPALVRQKFLEKIYRECLQLYQDSESASTRALEEEKTLVGKCNSKQVYGCSATNLITRLRKECREYNTDNSSLTSTSVNKTISHSDILAGKSGNVSWSIEKKAVFNPVGTQLYSRMRDYLMSSTELIDNGYPRKCPLTYKGCSGLAIIKQREDGNYSKVIEDSSRKTCDRCGISYLVTEDGFAVNKELCNYHTGRRFGRRTRTGNTEARYNCCDGDLNSTGCCTGPCHVFSGKSPDALKNFISAALEAGEEEKMGSQIWDIIGVDCEMVYTTRGTELARATFVDVDGKVIYDTLVKPAHPVLDYNTRYSGIDESMLVNTTTSMKEVHLKILANLKPNSIIVGHSLENDLIALKLIHGCVVDTSLVFPHKMGLPFKRALRNLSADYLGKIIQVGEGGHDSAEDARAALDLMIWKVKNDNQKLPKRSTGTE